MKLSLRASIASAAILLCLALTAHAAERDWQQAWCEGKGITEHRDAKTNGKKCRWMMWDKVI